MKDSDEGEALVCVWHGNFPKGFRALQSVRGEREKDREREGVRHREKEREREMGSNPIFNKITYTT